MVEIAVVPGDGIGAEVTPAAVQVLESLDIEIEFVMCEAGDAVAAETGDPLPDATVKAVTGADATLLGAAGDTAAEVVLPLRAAVDSYVNVRPARTYPGVDALQPATDIVILRENTEGVYAGHETTITPDVTTLTRVITRQASRRLAQYAAEYAASEGLDRFTIAHKDNVMRTTDGLFREAVEAVAAEAGIETDAQLMDALAMDLVMHPEEYDVIVTPNLAGDMLSDLAAGLVGGLGLLPSANIGPENAIFEPVHGTAPDIAGQGIANPTAAVLSGAMLLDFIDEPGAAQQVRDATQAVLADGPKTPDLGGSAETDAVTAAIIDRL